MKSYFGNIVQLLDNKGCLKIKSIAGQIIEFETEKEIKNLKLGIPVKIDFEYYNNSDKRTITNINFISKQDLIDKALKEYRKEKISLDDYIRICKTNIEKMSKLELSESLRKDDEDYEMEYEKNVTRIISKEKEKYKAVGEIIKGFKEDELYQIIYKHLKDTLESQNINTDILDFQIIGSRNKGCQRKNSDLDVLVEYNNKNLGEDSLFNDLNDEDNQLYINEINVDFNPITECRSGTLLEWLERNYEYDKYKEQETEEELEQ